MFTRIAFAWTWALIFMGLLRFPLVTGRWHSEYQFVVSLLLITQVVFVVVMTWRGYHFLRGREAETRQAGYELEQQALSDAASGVAYGD